jgi:hypothetical protein
MAELITIKGTAQAEGKEIKGYLFPDKIEDFIVPSTIIFAPNYGVNLRDKVTNRNDGKDYRSINIVSKENNKLIADNGMYMNWIPKGFIGGKPQMLIAPSDAIKQSDVNTNATIELPKSLESAMGKLKSFSDRAKVLSPIGFVAGLGFAHYKKSSVKGYIGYALLFSFIGTLVAAASVKIVPPKK